MGETQATHLGSLLHYFMIGRVLGLVVPMDVGDLAARTASLKMDHSMPIGRATYSVYLDRAFDVAVAGILFVPSVLFIVGAVSARVGIMVYGLAFLGGLVCFAFFGRRTTDFLVALFRLLFRLACKIPGLRNRVDVEAEQALVTATSSTSVARTLYLLSGVKFLCTAMRFASIALAMRLAAGVTEMLLFAPGAQVAAIISFTPGGMGIVDWSWSGLLYKIGVDKHDIVPYLVSLRLATWISVLVLAGFSRLVYRKPPRQTAGAGS